MHKIIIANIALLDRAIECLSNGIFMLLIIGRSSNILKAAYEKEPDIFSLYFYSVFLHGY